MRKHIAVASFIILLSSGLAGGEDTKRIKIIKDAVNLRTDSTISSLSIGKLSRGQILEVLQEKYDWYKVQLSKDFACYVYKDFFEKAQGNLWMCKGDNVNVRLKPSLGSAIIGRVKCQDLVEVKSIKGDFLEIVPPAGTGAWVHKKMAVVWEEKEEYPKDNIITKTEALKEQPEREVKEEAFEKEPSAVSLPQEVKFSSVEGLLKEDDKGNYILEGDSRSWRIKTSQDLKKFLGKNVKVFFEKKAVSGKQKLIIRKIEGQD